MKELDQEKLLLEYQPLIKAVYKKFSSYFNNYEDKLDLFNQVQYEFSRLVSEYDPRRGVDFPFYSKRMLNQRVYHYVTKCVRVLDREVACEDTTAVHEKFEVDKRLEFVECMVSLDDGLPLGEKQNRLMKDILIYKKSLEEIAKEEAVS